MAHEPAQGNTYVTATNLIVDIHNCKPLAMADGLLRAYNSVDNRDRLVLNAISGCKKRLRLKINLSVCKGIKIVSKVFNNKIGESNLISV